MHCKARPLSYYDFLFDTQVKSEKETNELYLVGHCPHCSFQFSRCSYVGPCYSFLQYLLEPMLLLGPVDIYIMNINVDKICKGNILVKRSHKIESQSKRTSKRESDILEAGPSPRGGKEGRPSPPSKSHPPLFVCLKYLEDYRKYGIMS